MMRLFSMFALLIAGAIVGCSESEPAAAVVAASNDYCPIMGGEVTDDGGRVTWNDQTIGFCCGGCIAQWNDLSESEKTEKLAAADGGDSHAHEGQDDHANHGHGSENTDAG